MFSLKEGMCGLLVSPSHASTSFLQMIRSHSSARLDEKGFLISPFSPRGGRLVPSCAAPSDPLGDFHMLSAQAARPARCGVSGDRTQVSVLFTTPRHAGVQPSLGPSVVVRLASPGTRETCQVAGSPRTHGGRYPPGWAGVWPRSLGEADGAHIRSRPECLKL